MGLYCNLQFVNNEYNGTHTRIIHFETLNSLTVIYLANTGRFERTIALYKYNHTVNNEDKISTHV